MTATRNMAPPWTRDSGIVQGPASHQSMQRLTTPAMQARLSILCVHRAEQVALNPPDVAERLRSLDNQIAATELALRWRGETA
jgi:hypothetical protein